MKLHPAMQWQREAIACPVWTKKQFIALIESGEMPGEVIAGVPFVYPNKMLTWRPVEKNSIPNFFGGD